MVENARVLLVVLALLAGGAVSLPVGATSWYSYPLMNLDKAVTPPVLKLNEGLAEFFLFLNAERKGSVELQRSHLGEVIDNLRSAEEGFRGVAIPLKDVEINFTNLDPGRSEEWASLQMSANEAGLSLEFSGFSYFNLIADLIARMALSAEELLDGCSDNDAAAFRKAIQAKILLERCGAISATVDQGLRGA